MTNQGSIIGADTRLQGTLTGDEDLHVQGRVEGAISLTGSLVVDLDAVVEADVKARQVVVRGALRGQITAEEMVHITGEGIVVGDITTARVAIDEGARYSGRLEMGQIQIPGEPLQAPASEEVRRARTPGAAKSAAQAADTGDEAPARAATGARTRKKAAPRKAGARKAGAARPPKPPTAAGKKTRTRRK